MMGNIRNIKECAKEKGVSLAHLCRKINKSSGYLSEFASRDGDVPEPYLKILADEMGVPVERLSGIDPIGSAETTVGQIVCKRIDALLARKNIKKYKFYSDVGITPGAFSGWNLGRANPSPGNLKRIADYLGVSTVALMTEDPAQKEKPTAQGDGLSEKQKYAIELVQSMSDDDLDRAIETLKIWTEKK